MTANVTPIIVVPLYKEFSQLTRFEILSLRQLFKILKNHPITFICPNKFELDDYYNEALSFNITPSYQRFHDTYFLSIAGYSKLMLSCDFYKRFSGFSHMLIYQLDAYVFFDELLEWCKTSYDYIGAPWVDDKSGRVISGQITGVGNGGFCLRRIDVAIRILSSKKPFKRFSQLLLEYSTKNLLESVYASFKAYYRSLTGHRNTGAYYASIFHNSEDAFWGYVVPESLYSFRLAPVEKAIEFSFEVYPEYMYSLNGSRLPFGCHAWFKYNKVFWDEFIYE